MHPKAKTAAALAFVFLLIGPPLGAQQPVSEKDLLQAILHRMDDLDRQNRQMAEEIRQLREQVAALSNTKPESAAAPPMTDRLGVVENRVDEQAQSKVEASQKFPITLNGEILFNAFANAGHIGALPDAVYSPFLNTNNSSGATFRQSIFGFGFHGPSLPGGGQVSGNIALDFYSGIPSEQVDWLGVRTADIALDWSRRSLTFAYDKPLISPRQPDSLAEVAIPPLADAGNLWLWVPQIRYEERFKLGQNAGFTAQAAILQTDETYNYVPNAFAPSLEKTRLAIEGRVGLWKSFNEHQRLEFAAGFHASNSHVAQSSVPSRVVSLDWLASPFSKLQISGTFFHGENFAALGALSSGFLFTASGVPVPVHGNGGWTQFSSPLTDRLTLNLFAGFQQNQSSQVDIGDVAHNISYAGNLMYHLSPNVVLSFEALQMRSRLRQNGDFIRDRYDLALAYLF